MKFFENEKVLKHILKNKIYKTKIKNYNEDLDWYFKETWSSTDENKYKKWSEENDMSTSRWRRDFYSFCSKTNNPKILKRINPSLIELVCDSKEEKEELLINLSKKQIYTYFIDEYEYIGYKKLYDEDSLNIVIKNKRLNNKYYINTNNKFDDNWIGIKSKPSSRSWNEFYVLYGNDDSYYITPDLFKNIYYNRNNLSGYNPLFTKLEEKGYIKLPTDDELNTLVEKQIEKWSSKGFKAKEIDKYYLRKYYRETLVIERSIETVKQYSLIQSNVKQYRKEFDGKARAYEDLKNMTQKASNLATSTSFSRVFKKIEIDPSSDFEVIKKLEKEFNKIIPFLIEDYNKDLTLRFRKINNLKLKGYDFKFKGVFFPSHNNITINANKHNLGDVPHIQSFMHQYAHFIDYQLGIKTDEDNFKLPFSLSDPEFLKIHSKYVDKFNEINGKNIDLIDKKAYLTSHTEVFARGFEKYLIEIGFESSFNRSKDHLNKIKQDVFNELDKADRDKLFEMYEGIFKFKEKMINNDLEKFENINLFESLEDNKEKETGKQLSLFDDSYVSDERIEVINDDMNNNLEENSEEKTIDRSNWGVSLFKVYGYKENLDEKFAEYNLGNPFGVVPLSKKGNEVAFGVICNAISLKKSNINNLIYLEKPNNIFAIPLDYIFTMDENSFKDETFYKKSFNEKLNVDDKFKHKTMNQLVKSFINENTKVHNLDVIQKDIDNDKKLNEGRER
ncbi:hypothetical protein [Mycoplasmopsis felis]|uniref:hypothetical protein n=1 Tax=Mycoplasmopsis felis TaxID=33923 RepID=UPI003A4E086A